MSESVTVDVQNRTKENLYTFDEENGIIIPKDTSDVYSLTKEDVEAALDVELANPATPLGRMVEWLAQNFASVLRINVQNANQLLLSSAAGQQLDTLADFFGTARRPAVATTVKATVTGPKDTELSVGVRAYSKQGDIYSLKERIKIGDSGAADAVFVCESTGPNICPEGSLNTWYDTVAEDIKVNNNNDGEVGREIEKDEELRQRIEDSRYSGAGFIKAIKSAVESVDNVTSSMVVENSSAEAITVKGIDNMMPHSIFVCVAGGDVTEIADALQTSKPLGTGFHRMQNKDNEATDVEGSHDGVATSPDDYGMQYKVYFYRPEEARVAVRMNVTNRSYNGQDIAEDVKAAIIAWADSHKFKIGESVYVSDIVTAVESRAPGVVVTSTIVNRGGTSASTFSSMPYLECPACAKPCFKQDDITVVEV